MTPAATPEATPVAELSYTDASRELDEIVAFFEQGDLDVDQLVGRLERATAIVDELDRRVRKTRAQVEELASAYHADEVIVVTITYDHGIRRRSYELLADAMGLQAPSATAADGPARLPEPAVSA